MVPDDLETDPVHKKVTLRRFVNDEKCGPRESRERSRSCYRNELRKVLLEYLQWMRAMKKWLAQSCFERVIITSLESFSSLLLLNQAHGKQKKRTRRHKKFRIKSNKYFMGEEEDDWFSYCCNVMKVEIKSFFSNLCRIGLVVHSWLCTICAPRISYPEL